MKLTIKGDVEKEDVKSMVAAMRSVGILKEITGETRNMLIAVDLAGIKQIRDELSETIDYMESNPPPDYVDWTQPFGED
jgi:hypothetical protein